MLITERDGGQRVAGTIKLAEGRITGEAADGYQLLIERTLEDKHFIDGGRATVTATSDPLRWIQSLPENYSGTYLRAQILDETQPPETSSTLPERPKRKPGWGLPKSTTREAATRRPADAPFPVRPVPLESLPAPEIPLYGLCHRRRRPHANRALPPVTR